MSGADRAGMYDLAGLTGAFKDLQDTWNNAYNAIVAAGVKHYAIGTVCIPSISGYEQENLLGDLIVPALAQLGGNFAGLDKHSEIVGQGVHFGASGNENVVRTIDDLLHGGTLSPKSYPVASASDINHYLQNPNGLN